MLITLSQQRALRQGLLFVTLGVSASLLYVIEIGELSLRYSVINSVTIGFLLSLILAFGELWLFKRQVRRVRFVTLFLVRSMFYLLGVLLVTFNVFVISRIRRFELSYREAIASEEFIQYMGDEYHIVVFYCLLIMVTVNFTSQMNRKLGPGMLWAYITGKYRTPVRQKQVIMFIDLVGSKVIMRKLGAGVYHEFLNDVIYDITESILRFGGAIVHYVDDEVVVSWPIESGFSNANCIRVFFHMQSQLRSLNETYYETYGFLPGIRAAIHCGTVIRAEVGSVKTEVCAVGDIMNTTSRVLDHAISHDLGLVISEDVKAGIALPVLYEYKDLGASTMKGKQRPLHLFAVESRAYAMGR